MHPSIPESSQTEGQSPRSCLPVASAYTLRWETRHCMSLIRACSHFSTKPGYTCSCAFLSAWGRSGVDTRLRGKEEHAVWREANLVWKSLLCFTVKLSLPVSDLSSSVWKVHAWSYTCEARPFQAWNSKATHANIC